MLVVDNASLTPLVAAAVGAAVVATIGVFQHYASRNLLWLIVGFSVFVAALAWTDPNPSLHVLKIGFSGLGTGAWVSAVRDERNRKKLKSRDENYPSDGWS